MKIVVVSHEADVAGALARFVKHKLDRALQPYLSEIDRVELRTGRHGPAADAGAWCQLQIRVRNASTVRTADVHPDLYEAVARACQRATPLVARKLDHSRARKREGRTDGMRTPGIMREAHPQARGTWNP